ncbi:DinB family protein [Ktedonobacter racemifer]|uniref:DinB-like domain-containing protein n=1 Tax=Ktedonobacter racemifer DSM 44963 TaxID=485913 RepID=D6TZS7_KTERA|nr:DinB family protein [Ktedonobacter racemifer]EFH82067.1 conserved hypothetical protein [Ktedonobacter racemifer DSM 44963]
MNANRAQLITTLEQTHGALAELTASLSDEALDFRPGAEEWSTREILAHLVDDEMFIMRMRVERMVKEEHPTLADNDEKKWHSHRNTSRDAVSDLLHDFAIQRVASLNILTFLSEEDWARTGFHTGYGEFTVEKWLEHWAEHDLVHIRQIEQNNAAYTASQR